MSSPAAPGLGRALRRLRGGVRDPIGVLLVLAVLIGPAALGYLLHALTARQDLLAREGQLAQLRGVETFAGEQLAGHLLDYAHWGEAFRKIAIDRDFRWFAENFGPTLQDDALHHAVAIVDAAGEAGMTSWQDELEIWSPLVRIGKPFADLLQEVTRQPFDLVTPRTGFATIGGVPVVLAIAPLTSSLRGGGGAPDRLTDQSADRRYVLFVRFLSARVIRSFQDYLGLSGLEATRDPPGPERQAIPLRGLDGAPVAWLSIPRTAPGSQALLAGMPWILSAACCLLAVILLLLRRARRARQSLAASEAFAMDLAHHDPLTGLPNRRALQRAHALAQAQGRPQDLILLDLDGFKEVNDTAGHEVGDRLLCAVADRLGELDDPLRLIVRLGGDEFAILCPHDPRTTMGLAQAVLAAVGDAVTFQHHEIVISASVGVASGEGGLDSTELFRRADVAMYAAKAAGKCRVACYEPVLDQERQERLAMEQDIQQGIERGEFRLVYQGWHQAVGHALCGVEALLRWDHPRLGSVPPGVFIPVAEATRTIGPLGRFVLEEACRRFADAGELLVAVNLSPVQFQDPDFVDAVAAILARTGFPAERLVLEITETDLVRHAEQAALVFDRLRALGIQTALDDFGSGYASLGYLRRFAFDKLKLDRSLTDALGTDPAADKIARAVIELGRALSMPVTAEGVETEMQARWLQQAGCAHLQGFLFGRPQAFELFQADEAPRAPRRRPVLAEA